MSWAKEQSMMNRLAIPPSEYRQIYCLLKGYIFKRDHFLKALRDRGYKLPSRASRGKTYLGTIANMELPADMAHELNTLIRSRERIAHLLFPYLKKVAEKFIKQRLGEYFDPNAKIETIIFITICQSLDRMSQDKIGLRVDFLISSLQRSMDELYNVALKTVPLMTKSTYNESDKRSGALLEQFFEGDTPTVPP